MLQLSHTKRMKWRMNHALPHFQEGLCRSIASGRSRQPSEESCMLDSTNARRKNAWGSSKPLAYMANANLDELKVSSKLMPIAASHANKEAVRRDAEIVTQMLEEVTSGGPCVRALYR